MGGGYCAWPPGECEDGEDDPRNVRASNVAVARGAEQAPPIVRGLLLFGQRRGPAWDRFVRALADELESCCAREEPVPLTAARVAELARKAAES